MKEEDFIPALKFHFLTPFYDFFHSLGGFGKKYYENILKELNLPNKKIRVLDAGCGTGKLAVEIKKQKPNIRMYAVDADERILTMAKTNATDAHVKIAFEQAFLQKLPFPDSQFDVVYSSQVIHHLTTEAKKEALKEIYRITKKHGTFLLVDFGRPKHWWLPSFALFTKFFEEGDDNFAGRLPEMMVEAGFNVEKMNEYPHTIVMITGRK